jgi:hypothetical protein
VFYTPFAVSEGRFYTTTDDGMRVREVPRPNFR